MMVTSIFFFFSIFLFFCESKENFMICATLNLSSANAFDSDMSRILSSGKVLRKYELISSAWAYNFIICMFVMYCHVCSKLYFLMLHLSHSFLYNVTCISIYSHFLTGLQILLSHHTERKWQIMQTKYTDSSQGLEVGQNVVANYLYHSKLLLCFVSKYNTTSNWLPC